MGPHRRLDEYELYYSWRLIYYWAGYRFNAVNVEVFIIIYWVMVFSLLIVVETVEIMRAVKRIREYGWRKRIFTYNSSQWSRNFTFGMSLTMTMHEDLYYMNAMYHSHEKFLTWWAWISSSEVDKFKLVGPMSGFGILE